MEIRVIGDPKEIAALVVAIQERQKEDYLLLAVDKNSDSQHGTQDRIEIKEC